MEKPKKPFYKRWWVWALAVIIVGAIASGGGEDSEPASTEPKQEAKSEEVKSEPKKEEKKEAEQEQTKEDNVPREYKAALEKAKQYAETMYMSKAAIYDQLVSPYGEAFPEDAAKYAIDHLEWDWKANALEKAKQYAEQMNMSNQAIYEQLTSEHGEKFTPEEAQYAIDHLK